ncbi:MAG TPA: hypothetical protein VFL91_03035 [Thermomicrobiales bacterium]|nr:hypothetical protein [Thermomicrobiales bacterium]
MTRARALSWTGIAAILAASALLLAAFGATPLLPALPEPVITLADTPPAAPPAYLAQYAADGLEFRPIDPGTLADAPAAAPWRIEGLTYGNFTRLASADGSTLAVMQYTGGLADAPDVTIRILDARTGAERVRFRTPFPVEMSGLTADGSRLLGCGPAYHPDPHYLVWDTTDGRLVATVPLRLTDVTIAPDGRRLYGLLLPQHGASATLVAWDIAAGRETGRRQFDRAALASPLAISPDGSLLAALDAGGDRFTLLDARRLQVLRSGALVRAPGVAAPAAPRPAAGETLQSTGWLLQFSPDGRYLYAWGEEEWRIDAGRADYRPLGLRAIDVARATVVAAVPTPQPLAWLAVGPDGAVYTLDTPLGSLAPRGPATLSRRAPRTLAVTAAREFPAALPDTWLVFLAPHAP